MFPSCMSRELKSADTFGKAAYLSECVILETEILCGIFKLKYFPFFLCQIVLKYAAIY